MTIPSFLTSLDAVSLILLFWYTTLIEIPRYVIGAILVAAGALWSGRTDAAESDLTVSVLLVGHNEARALRACVTALAEQTIAGEPDRMEVIVVDDGSTDGMAEEAVRLRREGLIDQVLRLNQRGGKVAGVNLGLTMCKGAIIVIADVDTTFDRDGLARLLEQFVDPRVGGVGGDLGVRNADASLLTRHQAIEYAIGISLGRRISDLFGTLSIISGAFGAFRRAAIDSVGGLDVEVGEDADLTMKLRRAGWLIRFAPEARALTNVPETLPVLINQRLRWDRGIVTIWLRKFRGGLDPRQSNFRLSDVAVLADVVLFQVLLAVAFPAYVLWLVYHFGSFAGIILGATLVGYIALDLLAFLAAAAVNIRRPVGMLPYLPFYTLLQVTVMRVVRLVALFQEFVFRSSYRDPYVPARVMQQVDRI